MNYKELVNKFGKGLMSHIQYEEIAKELEPFCPCNLLVFGLGEDSYLWQNLNINGKTIFLEDDNDWISKFTNNNLKIHLVKYKTNVQDYHSIKFDEEKIKIDLPTEVMEVLWDFIIVDAPLGHQPPRPYKGPGRMSSIFSAYSLIKDNGIVVIDDFGRDVEKIYSKHYFGEENLFKVVEKKVAFFKNKKMDKKMDKGVIYTVYNAVGDQFFKELSVSVETFRKFHPDLHITCFSDMKPDKLLQRAPGINKCVQINCKILRAKVDVLKHSPYKKTLFLDSDTVFDYPIYDIFDMLDEYELVIAHCLARKRKKYSKCIPEYKNIPYAFSEVNTGVMGFKKCDNIDKLLDLWPKYYRKYYNVCPYDQPTFRVSLWESKAKLYILPPEYNARSKQNRDKQHKFHHEFGEEHLKERIFHMHHGKEIVKDALQHCIDNYMPY